MAFTEYGVLMLASVLNSDRAIGVNIQIVRIFNRMREILASHTELLNKLTKIKETMGEHDNQIQLIFEYLEQLEAARQQELEYKSRKPIGFRSVGSREE